MMKMKKLLYFSVYAFILFPLLTLFFLYFSLPKAIVINKLLEENNIHIIPQSVKEDLYEIQFVKTDVFFGSNKVAYFKEIKFSLKLPLLEILAICSDNSYMKFELSIRKEITVEFNKTSCLEYFDLIHGKLTIRDSKLFGNVELKNIKHPLLTISSLKLSFNGREFNGKLSYQGLELTGKGSVDLNLKDPMDTKVKGSFEGSGIKIKIEGSGRNIKIK